MLVSKEDFKTHLRDYVIDAISDSDDDILQQAINRAISEAKGYLSNYDVETIFSAASAAEKLNYAALIGWIKDIAKWHFISLANVLADWEVTQTNYKNAITELGKIQAGKIIPDNWPKLPERTGASDFVVTSRPLRGNSI